MRKLSAYAIYLIHSGGYSLFSAMAYTIIAVYYVEVVGLNPLQLVLIGTALEVSAFLLEIPTGVVADVYSRRLSIIIGTALLGVSCILAGSIPFFVAILLAQVIAGAGYTFLSGAAQAWIADETSEAIASKAYMRGAQMSQLCSLIGIVVSTGLAHLQLNLPTIVGGGLFIGLAIFTAFTMPEVGFQPIPQQERTSWNAMRNTFREGLRVVRERSVLIAILSIGIFFGMHAEGLDRLWEAYLLKHFTFPKIGTLEPVIWFGAINVGSSIIQIVGTEIARQRLDTSSRLAVPRALLFINAMLVASVVAFGLAGNFVLVITIYWSVQLFRSLDRTISTIWINQHANSRVRATIFSMMGQADAFGQAVGGPILGAIGRIVSLRAAMVAAGALLSPVLPIFVRTIRRCR